MKRSDVRSAKFGELMETLRHHPDRDQIIDKEMGWDKPVNEEFAKIVEEAAEAVEKGEVEDLDDAEPVEEIPVYARAWDVGEKVERVLEPWLKAPVGKDEEFNELIGEAFINIHIVCAKIAGGHGMGYDDDVLCGNIVYCKRALQACRKGIEAWEELAKRGIVKNQLAEEIVKDMQELRGMVEQRMAELRNRVWW
jgi:hypothetical protein